LQPYETFLSLELCFLITTNPDDKSKKKNPFHVSSNSTHAECLVWAKSAYVVCIWLGY